MGPGNDAPAPPVQIEEVAPGTCKETPAKVRGYENICSVEQTPNCIPCEGQPGNDPDKWCGLDLTTNYYEDSPKTCRLVTCSLEITNSTLSPDGFERNVLAVNGQFLDRKSPSAGVTGSEST